MSTERKYNSLKSFYPYYLTEHQDPTCRRLHFTGTFLLLVVLGVTIALQKWILLVSLPILGYGFAWAGHFFFEKNKPATFQYPLYSLASDFIMFYHILTGQIDDKLKDARKEILGAE